MVQQNDVERILLFNTTLKGETFSEFKRDAVHIKGDNVSIENCSFYHSTLEGAHSDAIQLIPAIDGRSNQQYGLGYIENVEISGCIIDSPATDLQGIFASDGLFYNLIFKNNIINTKHHGITINGALSVTSINNVTKEQYFPARIGGGINEKVIWVVGFYEDYINYEPIISDNNNLKDYRTKIFNDKDIFLTNFHYEDFRKEAIKIPNGSGNEMAKTFYELALDYGDIVMSNSSNVFNVEQEYPHLKNLPKGVPRGYRNNNPGNIKDFGIGWQGLIKSKNDSLDFQQYEFTLKTGDRMCVFQNPQFGIRAIVMDLLYKQRNYRDCKSIRGIMERYAPAGKENPHQEQYIWHIANKIGTTDKAVISVKDYNTVLNFVLAIMEFENGTNIDIPYSDTIINRGISDAGIAMPGEEKIGGVKKQKDSNGIRKGVGVLLTTATTAGTKIAHDNGVIGGTESTEILTTLKDLATSGDIEKMTTVLSDNKDILTQIANQPYTFYDYGIFIMLAIVAYAALDWVLDRRLTNMLGIK